MNPKVNDALILESLYGWPQVIDKALTAVKNVTEQMLVATVSKTLATRPQTQLHYQAACTVEKSFLDLVEKQQVIVRKLLSYETYKPITYDTESMKQKNAIEKELLESRQKIRVSEHLDILESKGYKIKPDDRKKDTAPGLGDDPDPFMREIKAIATPLAYYDLAAARLMDNVAITTERELLYSLETNLKEALIEGLKCSDHDYCASLLAEDPAREEERLRLVDDKANLLKALHELDSLSY